jgi:XTP/dITP diphosphohydrolase
VTEEITQQLEAIAEERQQAFPGIYDSLTWEALRELIAVVARLRSPAGGCPWDLAQTPQTLTPYVIEEAYEVVDAIKSGDKEAIAEELGDLLLQVVLQSQIASEYGQFTLPEVAQGITQKLIRRHPHVFGDVEVQNVEEVRQNWEQIKATEKGENHSESQLLSHKLSSYARKLPPMMAAMKISQKAAAAGFEWENIDGVWSKFQEELTEFQAALQTENKAHQQAELGDLLFTIINLARWYDLEPEDALQETNLKFIQRWRKMEAVANRPFSDYSLDELENFWQQAKKISSREDD